MAKSMGKAHRSQCDCDSPHVTAATEKCNRQYGNKRKRAREKREWKKGKQ